MSHSAETTAEGYLLHNYLNEPGGLKGWLLTRDHKRVGILFLISAIGALFVGGMFALLIRLELLTPGPTVIDALTRLETLLEHVLTDDKALARRRFPMAGLAHRRRRELIGAAEATAAALASLQREFER